MIEGKQALICERVKKLDHEKWIARGLVVHQLRQGRRAPGLAAKSIRNQLLDVFAGERGKRDLLDLPTSVLDGLELARQRMSGIDLIVAIGADHRQMAQIRLRQEILQQL